MPRPRLPFGVLGPDQMRPFVLLPDEGAGEGGAGSGQGAGSPAAAEGAPEGNTESEFPSETKLAEMTGEQREAYWKHYARTHQAKARAALEKVKELEPKAQQYDALEQASRSEAEKAVEAAKAEALGIGRSEAVPQILAAELRAASKGEIDLDAAQKRVQYLNAAAFITDGKVDMTKVAEWVADQGVTPSGDGKKNLPAGFPDMGQGKRETAPVTGREVGLAEAARRGWITPDKSA